MNNCILMAEIIQEPELRYTSDSQTAIAEMLVQFPGNRPEDPPSTLKVVGWGNVAQEIQQRYHQGDRIIVEGRLSMNTVERPEGFKEKRAELTAQRVHPLDGSVSVASESGAVSEAPSPVRQSIPEGQATQARAATASPSNPPAFGGPSREPETAARGRDTEVMPQDEPQARPQPKTPPAPTYTAPTDADIDDIPF